MALNFSMPEELDGRRDAKRYVDGRLNKIVAAFRSQTTTRARRGFADVAVQGMATRIEASWSMIYDICVLVRDQKLFRLEGKETSAYVTFEAWFADRLGEDIIHWEELEGLCQFVQRDSPALKSATLTEVREQADNARVRDGDEGRSGGGGVEERFEQEMLPGASLTPRQRSDAYWMRRLRYYAPEVARAYERGEYPSAREAAIAARLVKILSPDEQIKSLWRYCTREERADLLDWVAKHMNDPTFSANSSGAA